jgi:hypothetical protein
MISGPQASDFGVTAGHEQFVISVAGNRGDSDLEYRVENAGDPTRGEAEKDGYDRQGKTAFHQFKHGRRPPESPRTRLTICPCV